MQLICWLNFSRTIFQPISRSAKEAFVMVPDRGEGIDATAAKTWKNMALKDCPIGLFERINNTG